MGLCMLSAGAQFCCVVHIRVSWLCMAVVRYVESNCTPDDVLGQMNVCLSSIAWFYRHTFQVMRLE